MVGFGFGVLAFAWFWAVFVLRVALSAPLGFWAVSVLRVSFAASVMSGFSVFAYWHLKRDAVPLQYSARMSYMNDTHP